MRPLIMRNGTICYSILYCNSPGLYIRLKQMYSVISVKLDWLPGNTKKWTIEQFVAFGVRFFHSWADPHTQLMNSKKGIEIETKEREQKGGGEGEKTQNTKQDQTQNCNNSTNYYNPYIYYQHTHTLLQTVFMCPRSIAGVPFDSFASLRTTLLLRSTCMRFCCNWSSDQVGSSKPKKERKWLAD